MAQTDGPDFICIGMPRAGTGWLFDQLIEHPDFWMPPIKEIRYLDRDVTKMRGAGDRLKRGTRRMGQPGKRQPLESRDRSFLETAIAISEQPMDLTRYASLFRMKGNQLTGDITPSYVRLSETAIEQVGTHLPQVKIVLLVRDLVTRAWSGLTKMYRNRGFDKSVLDDADRFRTFLKDFPNVQERSQPTKTIERWTRCAPKVQFRYFFFDDLASRPDWMLREILTFIGADPDKSGEIAPEFNRKGSEEKLELTPLIQAVLVDQHRDELRACAEQLGGHAKTWAAKYGV